LAAVYEASAIVWPFVFAFILQLLSQPVLRILERLRLPRVLAALLLIFTLLAAVIGLGTAISGPAITWAAKSGAAMGATKQNEQPKFVPDTVFPIAGCEAQIDPWPFVSNKGGSTS
jgi:predicted PurR-regulated permease PerM